MAKEEIETEIWIETSMEKSPDFNAHDKGDKDYEREPQMVYIKIQDDIKRFKDTGIGISWTKYARFSFFNKVNSPLFLNLSAF